MSKIVLMALDCGKEMNFTSLLTERGDQELLFSDDVIKKILIINWDHKENETVERIKRNNVFGKNVQLIYMHNYFSCENILSSDKNMKVHEKEKGIVTIPDKNRSHVYRSYINGVYTSFEMYNNGACIVDYLKTDFTRSRREYYDTFNYLRSVDYMGKNNTPIRRIYLNDSGNCYLSCKIDSIGDTTEYIFFDVSQKNHYRVFKSYDEIVGFFINSVISETESNSVDLICTNHMFEHASRINTDSGKIIYLS